MGDAGGDEIVGFTERLIRRGEGRHGPCGAWIGDHGIYDGPDAEVVERVDGQAGDGGAGGPCGGSGAFDP